MAFARSYIESDNELGGDANMYAAEAHDVCRQNMNRKVRIQTTSGHVVDGVIVHVDESFVYLNVSGQAMNGKGDCGCGCGGGRDKRLYYPYPYAYPYGYPYPDPYYNNVILPLSLFTLLAVALI
jgi:hypothetical protein